MLQSSKQQTLIQKNGNENNEMNIEHIFLPVMCRFLSSQRKEIVFDCLFYVLGYFP